MVLNSSFVSLLCTLSTRHPDPVTSCVLTSYLFHLCFKQLTCGHFCKKGLAIDVWIALLQMRLSNLGVNGSFVEETNQFRSSLTTHRWWQLENRVLLLNVVVYQISQLSNIVFLIVHITATQEKKWIFANRNPCWGPESELNPVTNSISIDTKFVPLRFISSKCIQIPPQNLQKRERAELLD